MTTHTPDFLLTELPRSLTRGDLVQIATDARGFYAMTAYKPDQAVPHITSSGTNVFVDILSPIEDEYPSADAATVLDHITTNFGPHLHA